MMLDVNDPYVFDKWRSYYDDLTSDEQLKFYDALSKKYPSQKSFDLATFMKVLEDEKPISVIEVGGWTGDLAHLCLGKSSVEHWVNYEICADAIAREKKSVGYRSIQLMDFNWFKNQTIEPHYGNDLFVATHFIEHISDKDFVHFLKAIHTFDHVYFEAPIGNFPSDWTNYIGTHILTLGWHSIESLMLEGGYEMKSYTQACKLFRRMK